MPAGSEPPVPYGTLRSLARNLEALRHYRAEQVVARGWILARRRLATVAPAPLRAELKRLYDAPPPARAAAIDPALREFFLRPAATPPERAEDLLAGRFVLLNEVFDYGERPDWRFTRAQRPSHLGRMTLHYHRFVVDLVVGALRFPGHRAALLERAAYLLDDWVAACPPGNAALWGDAWNTYTAASRLLNARVARTLCAEVPGSEARGLERRLDRIAARDARFVALWLEWDLGGNHLLRDATALVAAGSWFEGGRAREWSRLGWDLLRAELGTQILRDGFHEERSAMYHALLLEDLLVAEPASVENREALRPWLERLFHALRTLAHPDGDCALFNDATFGTASPPKALGEWLDSIGISTSSGAPPDLPDAGYYRLGEADEALIFDCGILGPDHLPAHAHCDALSFEWTVAGERVVTDTGVDRYEAGRERDFQRGTSAHSTLQVEGREQGEPFGSFRMGRRPRVGGHRLDERTLRGQHDGFGEAALHRRMVRLARPGVVEWTDAVHGAASLPVTVRTTLAAGCDVALANATARIRTASGLRVALEAPADGHLRVEQGVACDGFGRSRPRPVIAWSGIGGAKRAHSFRLTRES